MVGQGHGDLRGQAALNGGSGKEHNAHQHSVLHLPVRVAVAELTHAPGDSQSVHLLPVVQITLPDHPDHLLLHLIGPVHVHGLPGGGLLWGGVERFLVLDIADADSLPGDAEIEHHDIFKDPVVRDHRQTLQEPLRRPEDLPVETLPLHGGEQSPGGAVRREERPHHIDPGLASLSEIRNGHPHEPQGVGHQDGLCI